jgi:hypothetical protein
MFSSSSSYYFLLVVGTISTEAPTVTPTTFTVQNVEQMELVSLPHKNRSDYTIRHTLLCIKKSRVS